MNILLIDNGTSLLEKLQTLIPGSEVTKRWNDISGLDVSTFDMIILSGSRDASVVWQYSNFKDEINLIRIYTKPIIGICFGCELIAHSFGGTLKELDTKHTGIREIKIIDQTFFSKSKISVYEHHRWVIDTLPEEFEVIGESDDGPEIIRHKTRPIYGLQFHPENFTDETDGDEVFLNLLLNPFSFFA